MPMREEASISQNALLSEGGPKMDDAAEDLGKGMVEGIVDAMVNKHGQLDIRLKNVKMSLVGTRFGMRVDGTLTIAVHMRDLSDEEKAAHAASNVAAVQT
jgi:hypothetical protein